MKIAVENQGSIYRIGIMRSDQRNAVDKTTAVQLAEAMRTFEQSDEAKVAVLYGDGSNFCAGADLKAVASGDPARMNRLDIDGDGPMGPTRMQLSKPVIAMISGYCVAGGLELALWCDLRVADTTAIFGVFCRRFGVPLIDGGTVRLPRLIGQSRALDMILTGREVQAAEALQWGLVNRLVEPPQLEAETMRLATQLAALPQTCMRNDRRSSYEQWSLSEADAIRNEFMLGMRTLQSGETLNGAARFTSGVGRHGAFDTPAADTPP